MKPPVTVSDSPAVGVSEEAIDAALAEGVQVFPPPELCDRIAKGVAASRVSLWPAGLLPALGAACLLQSLILWLGAPGCWALAMRSAAWVSRVVGVVLTEIRLGFADMGQSAAPGPFLEALASQAQWWPALAVGTALVLAYVGAAFYREERSHVH